MKYGLYINNKIILCSSNKYECIEKGLEVLSKELRKIRNNNTKKDDAEMTADYLEKVCNFTYNARQKDGENFYADCLFNDKYIEVKPFTEKTYEVIYEISFEKNANLLDEYYIGMQQKFICYETNVDENFKTLKNELEKNVENELSIRGETFDDMLGNEVDCIQDGIRIYEVVDNVHKKFHTIKVRER